MKKIIFLLILAFLTVNLQAQPWSEQVSGVTATLTSVWSVDNSNVWVCGYLGTVLRTINGGTSWTNLTGNGIPVNVSLISICGFPSGNTNALVTGYLGATDTWVWKTTNGGTNWTQVFHETNGFIDAIWMTSATNGFIVGDPVGGRWSLWKTTNGGTNWDSTGLYLPQNGTETGYNNSLIYAPPNIWFGTNNTRIYFSSNNGATFTAKPTTGELNSYTIWFHPFLQNGLGLFGGANLWQTSNNGTNWTALTSMGAGNFGGITSTPLLTDNVIQPVWYVRTSNIIYYSPNFGVSWIAEYTNPATTTQYRHISMAYPGRGIWAVGTLGKITFHTPLAGIKKISAEVPDNYSLSQNYPNPFNSITNVKFQIINSGNVSLKVFNILGKEIATLVNEQLLPGSYEVTFDGNNLTSGIYFYQLKSDNYSLTKKLTLLK